MSSGDSDRSSRASPRTAFSGVVLSGGTGRRLGGVDKGGLELRGRTLLAWAVDALAEADEVVVVGPSAPTPRPVAFTREDPPSGGPVAGLLSGRDALTGPVEWLAVLAVDMPRVEAATFRRLLHAALGHDGAFLHDPEGARQLCGVLSVRRLDEVRPTGDGAGGHQMSLRRLLAPLDLAEVTGDEVETRDIDTWKDLRDLS